MTTMPPENMHGPNDAHVVVQLLGRARLPAPAVAHQQDVRPELAQPHRLEHVRHAGAQMPVGDVLQFQVKSAIVYTSKYLVEGLQPVAAEPHLHLVLEPVQKAEHLLRLRALEESNYYWSL